MKVLAGIILALAIATVTESNPTKSGIDRRGMDHAVRPQDDLFLHINGEWLKHTPIPADKSSYGSFEILGDQSEANIREIITEAVEGEHPQGSNLQKIGDFFLSYMDEETIDQRGAQPLQSELAQIDHLNSLEDIVEHFGYLQTIDVGSPIGFYVDQDDKDSTRYIAAIVQSGLSLPDRDYYLEDDKKYQSAREGLKNYVQTLFDLSGLPNGDRAANDVLEIETYLAEANWTRTELRDANKRYNKYQVVDLDGLIPDFPWRRYFAAVQLPDLTEVNVVTPSYFQKAVELTGRVTVAQWKDYMRFHVISTFAPALAKPFVDANFELYGKELAGKEQQRERWKRAVRAIAGGRGFGALGDAVGQEYVKRHYPPAAEARMRVLVDNLLKAYESSINDLTWMTPATKKRALEKLSKITTKIGYTESWRDYSSLVVEPDDLAGNLMRSAAVEYQRMIAKLGKPVDRTEWYMTPQTVNAYYNPGSNEIVFPAAILQPPFFDFEADDAVNYGSIGSVIGHEISHAFDDQGSKYDGDGNLNNWWTDDDRKAFKELTSKLVAQYSSYSPIEGKTVNGELTLGENIADLSGMSIAYKAYLLSLDGAEPLELDGWTGPQRFFIGWCQSWRRKYREQEILRRLLTDPHSPAMYRGNGPLINFDPFYEAFGLEMGDGLYQTEADRIRIW
ncbi:MAG: M13 family metallopeptidase [Planctomycetota bacterium]